MPSLKEIKSRIGSVSSTLKITSAMKLVASAKLHKAQLALGNLLPYETRLHGILADLMRDAAVPAEAVVGTEYSSSVAAGTPAASGQAYSLTTSRKVRKVALVAFASNSSLCGAFNSNAVREAAAAVDEYLAEGLSLDDITVYSIGRKMADAMGKKGFRSPADYSALSESPSYAAASALAQELSDGFLSGHFDRIELVYNHFRSTSSQPTVRKVFLPLSLDSLSVPRSAPGKGLNKETSEPGVSDEASVGGSPMIVEPSPAELVSVLLPKAVRLSIYSTLLDSATAEHAARTVAMQTATDNGNDLLSELTLEYNKTRQQKITSEILDIVAGSLQ